MHLSHPPGLACFRLCCCGDSLEQGALPTRPPRHRYHYNVSTARLDVHVNKGRADGLHVSSVGSSGDLWAVIMDAGTQFTAQVPACCTPSPRPVFAYVAWRVARRPWEALVAFLESLTVCGLIACTPAAWLRLWVSLASRSASAIALAAISKESKQISRLAL